MPPPHSETSGPSVELLSVCPGNREGREIAAQKKSERTSEWLREREFKGRTAEESDELSPERSSDSALQLDPPA